ncbi:MAG: hydroxyacid dehydrogenase [Candidatus Bathyarchaeota archaeon]|nr:hydroxyacid dehydrogenase [Candidatus Bathyarchaeota archaeon]MDH5787157.1 hydroxyacid dehydrogenase [Candidatus Bathyarchaeota archaeon]
MKKDLNIVVVEPIHVEGIKILKRYGKVIQLSSSSTEDDLLRVSGKADAFITRGFMKISEKVFRTTERLKVIGVHGVGVDHIDIDFAQKKGIQIVRTPSALAVTVAEFTIGLMLSLLRNIPKADLAVRKGQWGKKYSELIGVDLTRKTVGIIGLGTIGSEVARRLKAFNVEIVYYKRVRNHELEKQLDVKYVSLKRLLEIVDIISIHVPLTLETHHMISTEEFALMKHGVYIINTSRGAVIEEKALYEALVSRRVAGAALDVFESEPICPDSQLIKLDRVILTPHLAASSEEALRRMSVAVAEEVIGILVPSKT